MYLVRVWGIIFVGKKTATGHFDCGNYHSVFFFCEKTYDTHGRGIGPKGYFFSLPIPGQTLNTRKRRAYCSFAEVFAGNQHQQQHPFSPCDGFACFVPLQSWLGPYRISIVCRTVRLLAEVHASFLFAGWHLRGRCRLFWLRYSDGCGDLWRCDRGVHVDARCVDRSSGRRVTAHNFLDIVDVDTVACSVTGREPYDLHDLWQVFPGFISVLSVYSSCATCHHGKPLVGQHQRVVYCCRV